MKIPGRADMNVQIGGKDFRHNMIVAEVSNESLLGMDFLRSHAVTVDFGEKVYCSGKLVQSYKAKKETACHVL